MGFFGKSEVALRSLSIVFYLGFLLMFYLLAKRIFSKEWPKIATIIAALSPMLVYKDEKRVFLYNPERVKLPNYLGIILIPEEKQRFEFASFSRVYIVGEDGSYSSYE